MSVNPDNIDELEIRGRMDIEDIVKYQINRCNISSTEPDPAIFYSNVLVLLDLLPAHKREQVIADKESYGEEKERIVYDKYWCEKPVTSSQRTIKEFVIDYHHLYRKVLDAFADSGLTWKIEGELIEEGTVKKKLEPTPYYPDEKKT